MTKKEHIEYWLNSAKEDMETMNYLYTGKRYVHALFFGHLYMEKICKALWVKNNRDNHPPKIHNLLRLLSGIEIGLEQNDLLFLDELEVYQLEGRYPDYANALIKQTTKKITEDYFKKIKSISKWLQQKL